MLDTPYQHLQMLEAASSQGQFGEKSQGSQGEEQGLVVVKGNTQLILPFAQGVELIPDCAVSRLPLTQPWVNGLAQVRSSLYSVVDFFAFLHRQPSSIKKRCKVITLPSDDVLAAIAIDGNVSMLDYSRGKPLPVNHFPSSLRQYLSTGVEYEGSQYGVIDYGRLLHDNHFHNIGLDIVKSNNRIS